MKRIYLLTTFIIIVNVAFSQSEMTQPSSPESQSLLRNVNIRVNKGTGTAGVDIPLYTIKNGANINVPISLSYNCSGIKVQDVASCVGLGWNLSAGGKITRVIVDNDDLIGGYCFGQGNLANNFTSWWSGANLKRERVDHCTSANSCTGCITFDGEPDLYYYEIPGKTGMFTIDKDRKAWTIPYSPINIELDNDLNFTIIDETGIKYIFDLRESTQVTKYSNVLHNSQHSISKNHISTWHLTKINSLTGDEIKFDYVVGNEINYSNYNYTQKNNEQIIDKSTQFKSSPYYLNKITWNGGKLEFLTSSNRSDLTNSKRLDEIKIYSPSNTYLKSVNLTYSNFNSPSNYKRLKLDEVSESNGGNRMLINKFRYNTSANLPDRNNKDFDHWGYYNGKNNSTFFPTDGANRLSSLQYTTANILNRVYYNTGGYVDYEYEENKLANGSVVGGVRIKSLKKYSDNNNYQMTSYSYAEGSGVTIYSNDDYKDNWNPGLKLSYLHDDKNTSTNYSTVTETLSNGSKIVSKFTSIMDTNCHDDLSKRHISINENDARPNDAPTVFPNSSRFWRRGLLKEEIQYNLNGNIVKNVKYFYTLNKHIKKEIKGYFTKEYNMPTGSLLSNLIVYSWLSEPIYVDSIYTSGINIPTMAKKIIYDTTYFLPIGETVKYNNNDTYITKTKYPFSYQMNSRSAVQVENNAINVLLQNGVIAQPIEIVKYKNNNVIGAELNIYKPIQNISNRSVPIPAKKKILLLNTPITSNDFMESAMATNGLFINDDKYVTSVNYDNYDNKLNLISSHLEHGQSTSVIYGYNSLLPIANISNAVNYQESNSIRENQVFHTSFEEDANALNLILSKTGGKACKYSYNINLSNFKPGIYQLSYWKSVNNGTTWSQVTEDLTVSSSTNSYVVGNASYFIDEVRLMPKNASMSTCTHIPNIGKTSETDINGVTTYYEYDVFGRLLRILDNERNKVKEYKYFVKSL